MGLATAKRFVDEGAFVYITGRRQMELDKAVSLIGRSVVAVKSDVSNLADLDRLYAKMASEKGGAPTGGGRHPMPGSVTTAGAVLRQSRLAELFLSPNGLPEQ